MPFQSSIDKKLASGVLGEIQDTTNSVVDTYLINSASGNKVAFAFTLASEGLVDVGGTNLFTGIAVNPKHYLNYNGNLDANDELLQGTAIELATKGRVLVDVGGTANIGDAIFFVDADGSLGAGTAGAGQTQIANTEIVKFDVGANGLAWIELGKVT